VKASASLAFQKILNVFLLIKKKKSFYPCIILFKTLVLTSKFHLYLPAHILCFPSVTTGAESLAGPLRASEILPFYPQKPSSDTLKLPCFTCLQNQLFKCPLIFSTVIWDVFGEAKT